ncbi:MAG: SUMF1/EgtB/PvdO family nonheme iron enzyme [Gammaproteobacteria bacterium]|jgi:formylglycine-generating enzyme required for sulfatase activity/rhodanese-related sulfurtransferase/predicted  nucleic acid-binding Zn-ribbon protein
MFAAKKTIDKKVLQELVPLNSLSADRFREVADKIVVEEVRSGRYLFRKGDRDNQSIYLLEGKVNLIDGGRQVTAEVEAGTDRSRYPIANLQPRPLSARAGKKVLIARIDAGLLDAFLAWDQDNGTEAVEITADDDSDWMTRMLQSGFFARIPPATIQRLLMKMEPYPVEAGETVIAQGEEGQYFYSISKGRCAVTHRSAPDAEEQLLAELAEGNCFGEEALVTEMPRNATVTMQTDGLLMRLSKEDFIELLQKPLLRRVRHQEAVGMVEDGAVWLDVRSPEEFEAMALEDSVNIPLAELRGEMPELVFNAKYVICSDREGDSKLAAFILSHRGFDVYVLAGGLASLPGGEKPATDPRAQSAETGSVDVRVAEVIDFDKGRAGATAIQAHADVVPESGGTAGGSGADAEELDRLLEPLQEENRALNSELQHFREDKAALLEQLELARAELGESGEKLEAMYAGAKSDADEKRLLQDQLKTLQEEHEEQAARLGQELERLQRQLAGLESEARAAQHAQESLQDQAAERDNLQQRTDSLQQELAESQDRIAVLQAEVATAEETVARQQQSLETERQQQQARIADLDSELAASRKHIEHLQDELDTAGADRQVVEQSAQAELEKYRAQSDNLAEELAALQGKYKELAEELEQERQKTGRLQEENGGHDEQLDALRAELEAGQRQIQELSAAYEQGQQQLQAVSGEREADTRTIQSLQQEVEQLRDGQRQLEDRLHEQTDRAGKLSAEKQAADQALAEQQAALHAARQSIDELQEQNGRLQTDNADEATRLAELVEAEARLARELERLGAERDGLQQNLDAAAGNEQRLQQEIEVLKQQLATIAGSAEERQEALQEELEAQRLQLAAVDKDKRDRETQLEALHNRLAGQEDSGRELEQELDRLRRLYEEVQQELAQQTERNRQLEEENVDAIHKAREDLSQENSNGKELLGQIERLRKKLGQSEADLQALRADARNDLNNVREELHAERQARAGERAEMAARQRELKQQLAAIADEHEEHLAKQSDLIEQARDAVRAEERTRLQEVLDGQAGYEKQIAELQQQLEQARCTAEAPAAEDQNRHSGEAVAELETRLRQLSGERDAALAGQQEMRERLDTLQGELEAARNPAGAGEAEALPGLRAELEAARKDVEIAAQLRAEAEAAHAIVVAERDALLVQVGNKLALGEPLNLEVAGAGAGAMGQPDSRQGDKPQEAVDAAVSGTRHAGALETGAAARTRWIAFLGSGLVLVMAALAGRLWLEGANLIPGIDAIPIPVFLTPGGQEDAELLVAPVPPAGAVPRRAAPVAPLVEPPLPRQDVATPPVAPPVDAPVPLTSGPAFRDRLRSGGRGPLMVELPGASYQMGSASISMNFDEGPVHTVTLDSFAIAKYEVTFAEYDSFARATGRRLPDDENWGRGNRPVVNVSWSDASAYAEWLSRQTGHSYRLPTEAEWEFAARGGTKTSHWFAIDSDTVPANCFNCGSEWDARQTAPVGSFEANNFGLHDTAGNAQEWVEDCYHDSYEKATADGSAWRADFCTRRVVRGGAYSSPLDSLRSAKRTPYDQEVRLDNTGFRVVRVN